MIRRPPRSTRTDTLFPTRRSSDLHAPPLKGPVLRAGSRSLLLQLVDIFYGGRGQLAAEREELTDAEDRFAARLGRDIGMQLAAAWRVKLAIEPELDRERKSTRLNSSH